MIKVKVTWPPEVWDIAKYSPNGDCIWGDYEFFLNKEIDDPDYWIVCGNTIKEIDISHVSKMNTIFITSESADIVVYPEDFLKQFGYISSFRDDLKHPNFIRAVPVLPWFINRTYEEQKLINTIPKKKKLSLLASDKKISINHIDRLNFVKKIKKHFGSEIDIFGAGYTEHIKDKIPTHDPYQYTLVLETISVPEYFSEKLADSYLSLCYPIYYGCSNLNEYFDKKSYSIIDIHNVELSIKVIKNILDADNFYDERLKYLVEAKNKYLQDYSLFSVLAKILNEVEKRNMNLPNMPKENVVINKFIPKKDLQYMLKRGNLILYDKFSTLINR